MESGDNPDAKTMSREMLEDIFDGSTSHLSVNMRVACFKIRYSIKESQAERKIALLSTRKWVKVYKKF